MKHKTIVLLTVTLFLISPILADFNVTTNIQTDGNVNYNSNIDAGGDVNVTIDGTDINQELGNINENLGVLNTDVYGASPNSPDDWLEGAEEATDYPISDICSDPSLQEYFDTLSAIPPAGFKEEMKWIGYDDEAHVNIIWTICQEEKLKSMGNYVSDNEQKWREDRTGASLDSVADLIRDAIRWLKGDLSDPMKNEQEVGQYLDSYFASDQDTYYLFLEIQDLKLRVESLENTLEETSYEAYCQGKLEVLEKYKLESVTCGDTMYVNHKKSPITGKDTIYGITPTSPGSKNNLDPSYLSFKGPEQEPDIRIDEIIIPNDVQSGEEFDVVVKVKNVGSGKGEVKLGLGIPESWKLDKEYVYLELEKDEKKEITFTVKPDKSSGLLEVNLKYEKSGETVKISSSKYLLVPKYGIFPNSWLN